MCKINIICKYLFGGENTPIFVNHQSIKMYKLLIYLSILTFVFISCGESVSKKEYHSPDEAFGELFREVQLKSVFPDSKTFPDCIPKFESSVILENYQKQKNKPGFDLKKFVYAHFIVSSKNNSYVSNPKQTVEEHIQELWPILTRKPKDEGGTMVPLIKPYIVPGGRFREIYYWDSYFTMLGLEVSGKDSLISNMVLNFAQLIQDFNHIPNGNRSYYFSRSQPPFFPQMVKLLSHIKGYEDRLVQYLPQMQKEYQYWMSADRGKEDVGQLNQARLNGEKSYRKVVFVGKNDLLNRYYDDKNTPRPEAFKEDIATAKLYSRKNKALIYRDLRSAAESGWDFSSRWLADEKNLSTIHTTDLLPIDLNALLYDMEVTIANAYQAKGQKDYAQNMRVLASKRKAIFDKYFWNESAGFYFDYDFVQNKQTNIYSLAAVYPLFFKMASSHQAAKVAQVLEKSFLQAGGLQTTLHETNQQWDGKNGWAPLQYLAIVGLRNYGFHVLADKIKQNWVENNIRVYKNTGKLLEKYNVKDITLEAGGGEYPVQDGFGWTNGVLLKLLSEKRKVNKE